MVRNAQHSPGEERTLFDSVPEKKEKKPQPTSIRKPRDRRTHAQKFLANMTNDSHEICRVANAYLAEIPGDDVQANAKTFLAAAEPFSTEELIAYLVHFGFFSTTARVFNDWSSYGKISETPIRQYIQKTLPAYIEAIKIIASGEAPNGTIAIRMMQQRMSLREHLKKSEV